MLTHFIPYAVMAFLTYVLSVGLALGAAGKWSPELLGTRLSQTIGWIAFEVSRIAVSIDLFSCSSLLMCTRVVLALSWVPCSLSSDFVFCCAQQAASSNHHHHAHAHTPLCVLLTL
jgi:hypothetical protein